MPGLEPDPALEEFVVLHRKQTRRRRPIPSVCPDCSAPFDSKFLLEEHQRLVHPIEPVFNDDRRAEFVNRLKSGVRFFAACKATKISPETVKRAMKLDPAFQEKVELAEEEAAEKAEVWLWEQAESGNMTAILKILDRRQAKRWGDAEKTLNINVQGQVTHSAAPELMAHQQKVFELQARVQDRMRLKGTPDLPIIDVEEVIEND